MKLFLPSKPALKAAGCCVFAALLLGFAAQSQAQLNTSYGTTFDNDTPNIPLDGQDGWSDSDSNSPDAVAYLPGFSVAQGALPANKDYFASIGGEFISSGGGPSQPNAVLSHAFTPVGTLGFDVDFGIENSSVGYDNSNTFSFAFISPTGTAFSINFVPNANTDATVYAVRYTIDGVQTTTGVGIPVQKLLHLSLSVNETAVTPTLTFQVTGAAGQMPSATNVALGNDVRTITSLATTYDVAPNADAALMPGSGAGSNFLFFDNLTAVPEPSTYALVGLGVLGLAARFRRKARA